MTQKPGHEIIAMGDKRDDRGGNWRARGAEWLRNEGVKSKKMSRAETSDGEKGIETRGFIDWIRSELFARLYLGQALQACKPQEAYSCSRTDFVLYYVCY